MIILPEKELTEKYIQERDNLLSELSTIQKDIQKNLLKLEQTSQTLFVELERLRSTSKTIKEKETLILNLENKVKTINQDIISLQKEKDTYTNLSKDIQEQQNTINSNINTIKTLTLEKESLEFTNSKLQSDIQIRQTRLICLKNEHGDVEKQIMDNTSLLQKLEKEIAHREQVETKIAQQLHEIQIDQKNMSQYIRPIQKKLDKMGIDINFLDFIQDL